VDSAVDFGELLGAGAEAVELVAQRLLQLVPGDPVAVGAQLVLVLELELELELEDEQGVRDGRREVVLEQHRGEDLAAALNLAASLGSPPCCNARTEQVNSQLRLITRRAYGFHTPEALTALAMLILSGLCHHYPHDTPETAQGSENGGSRLAVLDLCPRHLPGPELDH